VARQRPDWLKVLFTCDLSLPLIYLHDQHIADSNAGFAAGIANIETRLLGDQNWSTSEGVAAISGYAPFYLHYQGLDNTQLQRRFGRIVETIAARAWPQFAEPVGWRPMNHGGRLRIGFVSAYLRRHSVGHFFGAWLRQLDPQKFESFVWYTGEATDDVTESIHRRAAHFSHSTFDIAALAAAIRASRLDILIYLDVGMHPQSQVLAALRLAPIQCATFGHPVTTGIGSIGYYLSAAAAEPDNAEEHYHEQLIRLPRFAVSFARPDVAFGRPGSARVSDSSVQRRLRVLCPQPLFKILPHFDRLATRIVRELPGCKLLFFQSLWPKVNDAFVVRISAALRAAGIDPGETLEFLPILPHGAYLDTLASADVILDTPGFSGGNSSFDAIAVNAPIVTQRGAMLRGRQTAAMLDIVGLPEYSCVADDDYVQQAISVASSKARQMVLRDRMKSGGDALFSDAGAVPALENALIELAAHSTQG
jgi:predicted O-linked N-acetylglucosamine transferase (SPINDLY family)